MAMHSFRRTMKARRRFKDYRRRRAIARNLVRIDRPEGMNRAEKRRKGVRMSLGWMTPESVVKLWKLGESVLPKAAVRRFAQHERAMLRFYKALTHAKAV